MTAGGLRLLLLILTVTFPLTLQAVSLEERVVILANSRQPESVRLAEFYAAKRAIPAANIVALPLPETERRRSRSPRTRRPT